MAMKFISRIFTSLLTVGLLSAVLVAQTTGAGRYDQEIQTKVTQKLAQKQQFRNVRATVEDGIVNLTGTVELYQQKLDAANRIRKTDKVQGVRNQITVSSTAPDAQLAAQLGRKLQYDRVGYDNLFNYVTASVKDGVVTLNGETRTPVSHDSALAIADFMPGVKDVVDNIKVLPVSRFDDQIRLRTARALYGSATLGKYGTDPARPIRIVVDNGHVALYGTVDNAMDKQIAGMRASQVFGVFSVQNNLTVANRS
jgi:hyperosmotically inducible periplasmic protein